jgi:hypothetical protein
MNTAEIIVHDINRHHVLVILNFLCKCVRERRESAICHTKRQILAFNVAGGNQISIDISPLSHCRNGVTLLEYLPETVSCRKDQPSLFRKAPINLPFTLQSEPRTDISRHGSDIGRRATEVGGSATNIGRTRLGPVDAGPTSVGARLVSVDARVISVAVRLMPVFAGVMPVDLRLMSVPRQPKSVGARLFHSPPQSGVHGVIF